MRLHTSVTNKSYGTGLYLWDPDIESVLVILALVHVTCMRTQNTTVGAMCIKLTFRMALFQKYAMYI